MSSEVFEWTTVEVKGWLEECGFSRFVQLFCEDHEIDGRTLLSLTEQDLRLPPLQLKKLGDIKKLSEKIRGLQLDKPLTHDRVDQIYLTPPLTTRGRIQRRYGNGSTPSIRNNQSVYSASSCDSTSEDEHYELKRDGAITHPRQKVIVFDPEYRKTFASFIYAMVSMFMTSFTMVIVHDRVPDKMKHPPLPDIFLDNVPLIPYAFKLAEMCGLALLVIWSSILVFHRHRWILLRRMNSIGGTIFLLRCITMFVTSLSVPGDHLQCHADRYNTTYARVQRALEIFFGGGMSLTGVHTCGDYMFSGHTVVLTLFNHFITEYTPTRWSSLHTVSWVLNLFGVFFILAAHEHYSIDVVIAFYITSRIFLYYHMLANTRSYRHSRRIRIWFPLLSYFECNVPGKVRNEYEWPLTISNMKRWFHQLSPRKTGGAKS